MEAKTGGEEKTQLIAKVQVLAANIEQDKLHHASMENIEKGIQILGELTYQFCK